jgi:hypothetical protein
MKELWMNKLLLLSLLQVLSGCGRQEPQRSNSASTNGSATSAQSAPAQRASGEVRVSPSEAQTGTPVEVAFKLKDSSGQVISDANVQAVFVMDMGNMTMREPVAMKWNGLEYVGRYAPTMAGDWEVNVEARKDGQLLLSMPSDVRVQPKR